jgi:hypothetical protein
MTIYVFTSGRVIITLQIHSSKKLLKALKWTMNTGEQQELRYPAARFNEKGCFAGVGWRCAKNP